jgi:hypothetical protein
MEDGVKGDKHLRMVTVCVLHQACDVGHRIGGFGPGAKSRPANVNGIRTMINGFDTELGIFSRGQQFKVFTGFNHGVFAGLPSRQ